MFYILCGLATNLLIGAIIGSLKGRVGAGMLWAFFLGPIGWLITFFIEDYRKRCPKCGALVDEKAFLCPSCGAKLVVTYSDYKKFEKSIDVMADWKPDDAQDNNESDDVQPPPPLKKVKNNPDGPKDAIYLLIGEKKVGPFSRNQVQDQLNAGMIVGDAMFWHKGLKEWQSISEFQ